jgi:hypothetical protein
VVADVDGGCGGIAVEQFEPDGCASGVVEQPDPVAEQHRRDVQVNLIDESAFEVLSADGGRKTSRFLPPAASSPIRTASATSQVRKVTPVAGGVSSGWWVWTNSGPCHAPPWMPLT